MNEMKFDINKEYTLTKILPNGRYMYMTRGDLRVPDGVVRVGEGVIVGRGISDIWHTTAITEMEKIGKGIKFDTLNSTYILEEYEPGRDPRNRL